jgi:hypothetical protein
LYVKVISALSAVDGAPASSIRRNAETSQGREKAMSGESAAAPLTSGIVVTNGQFRLSKCRHGLMLYNLNDIYIGTTLDLYGEFSEGELDLFRQIVRPGMTVVEVGANIGAHTVSIAQCLGGNGRLLAFEPQLAIFQMLCANMALNELEPVEPHWAAVGDHQDTILVPRLKSSARNNFRGLSDLVS